MIKTSYKSQTTYKQIHNDYTPKDISAEAAICPGGYGRGHGGRLERIRPLGRPGDDLVDHPAGRHPNHHLHL